MKFRHVAKSCGIFFGASVLGAGSGSAAGALIDYYKDDHRKAEIEASAENLEYIKQATVKSEQHIDDIQHYGAACIDLVRHYSVGGALQDKPESVATANIANEPGLPCGSSATDILVAYNDISTAFAGVHEASQFDYDAAIEKYSQLMQEQSRDNDYDGWLYAMGVGAAVGLLYGGYNGVFYLTSNKETK